MAILECFFENVGTTVHGAQTRDGEEGLTVVLGTVCQMSKHFAPKIVVELIEKTWLLLLLLLLLPKPPSVTSLRCDERQCFQLNMKTNGVRRSISGPHGGKRTAADARVVFVTSSYADIALGANGRKSRWWWRWRGGR